MQYLSKKKIDAIADIYVDIFEQYGLDELRKTIRMDFPSDVNRIVKAVVLAYERKINQIPNIIKKNTLN